jgi:hypothetical protein
LGLGLTTPHRKNEACYESKQEVRIYKTIILPVVLHGCETWSLTSREEHRLKVFENRVLRRIFGPKRDEETGGWSNLHNEELHNLYSSPSIHSFIHSFICILLIHTRLNKPIGYRTCQDTNII